MIQVCDKSRCSLRTPRRNTKPRWEIKLERQVKKLRQQARVLRNKKKTCYDMSVRKDKNKTAEKSDNTTWRDKSKDIDKKNGDLRDIEIGWSNTNKIRHFKITKENSTNKFVGWERT